MELVYRKSESGAYPPLLDTTSSKKVVYIRKNVQEVTFHDDISDTDFTMYEYDEAVLTKDEYKMYLIEQASEERDTNAELAIAELAETVDENDTSTQLAVADLAETFDESSTALELAIAELADLILGVDSEEEEEEPDLTAGEDDEVVEPAGEEENDGEAVNGEEPEPEPEPEAE